MCTVITPDTLNLHHFLKNNFHSNSLNFNWIHIFLIKWKLHDLYKNRSFHIIGKHGGIWLRKNIYYRRRTGFTNQTIRVHWHRHVVSCTKPRSRNTPMRKTSSFSYDSNVFPKIVWSASFQWMEISLFEKRCSHLITRKSLVHRFIRKFLRNACLISSTIGKGLSYHRLQIFVPSSDYYKMVPDFHCLAARFRTMLYWETLKSGINFFWCLNSRPVSTS